MQDRICQVDETSCNARPDHTFGSDTDLSASQREVRFAPISGHRKRDEAAYSGLACFAACPTWYGIQEQK
jgi:hypothetical protein